MLVWMGWERMEEVGGIRVGWRRYGKLSMVV